MFNESQVSYTIQKISERLSLETTIIKNVLYDFIERLDNYRRHGQIVSKPKMDVGLTVTSEVKEILQGMKNASSMMRYVTHEIEKLRQKLVLGHPLERIGM